MADGDIAFTEFDWDETKRNSNAEKYGIDFEDALIALAGPRFEYASPKDGEDRVVAICLLENKFIAVVYTMRGSVCRIISARAARHNEQREYYARHTG